MRTPKGPLVVLLSIGVVGAGLCLQRDYADHPRNVVLVPIDGMLA